MGPFSTDAHRSCWDCDFIRVAGGTSRRCSKHRKKHIPLPTLSDVEEIELFGGKGTVADRCRGFTVAREIPFLLVFDERVGAR